MRWYATRREAVKAALNSELAAKDRATQAITLLDGVEIEMSDTERKPPSDKRY